MQNEIRTQVLRAWSSRTPVAGAVKSRLPGGVASCVSAWVACLCVVPPLAIAQSPYKVAWTTDIGAASVATTVAVDADGNILVSGGTLGNLAGQNAGGTDAFVAKYDPQGQLVWARQFGNVGEDRGRSVAVDVDGSVYVTGPTRGATGGTEVLLRKFDSSGDDVWMHQFGDLDQVAVIGTGVSVLSSGDVIMAGHTYGRLLHPIGLGSDPVLYKYTSSGENLWATQNNNNSRFYFQEVTSHAVDQQGNSYLAGLGTSGDLWYWPAHRSWVEKYDAAGQLLWSRTPDPSGAVHHNNAMAVGVDGEGNVYVAGTNEVGGGNPPVPLSSYNAYLVKYSPDGDLLWNQQFDSPSSFNNLAIDPAGNVYVGLGGILQSVNAGGVIPPLARAIVKYDASGTPLWTMDVGVNFHAMIYSEGSLYLAGSSVTKLVPVPELPAWSMTLAVALALPWAERMGRRVRR
ncbi:MAG TPA: SBBP repeat-containing protein [Lacipirellulaceae bacterium]|nr:SBBP repeat-containing protein [Lacipirellulaceae bacterium]HMP07247.1 SBBP repeat-containing protein [Lacipirellulaceae bacterium]